MIKTIGPVTVCTLNDTFAMRIGRVIYTHAIHEHTIRYKRRVFDLRDLWPRIKGRVKHWKFRLTPWPVYLCWDSTDCDHFRAVYARRYPNGWTACRAIDAEYEDAEGPTYWHRMTKREYDEFKPWHRDIAAEQAGY